MPRRDHARPLRAQPPARTFEPSARNFLPPQPLADRDRRFRLGRKSLVAIVIGVGLAVTVPVAFAALGPAGRSLQPLGGGVAGAASERKSPSATPAATADPSPVPTTPPDPIEPTDAGPPTAAPVSTLTGYRWPISQGRISLPFKAIPGGEWFNHGKLWHDGVDMASFCGAPVRAAHDGIVLAAGRHFDDQIGWIGDLRPYYHLLNIRHMWGDLPIAIVTDDGNGYRSIYAHFRDVTVRVGQHVKAGQLIGHEGATGHASGCHVHYGLFSPLETDRFGVRADILRRLKLPHLVIARVDPLAVMPGGDVALRTRQIAMAINAAKAQARVAAAAAESNAADVRSSGR